MTRPVPASLSDDLAAAGLRAGDVLGHGVEGTVVDVGDGRVAKVWHHAQQDDLLRRQTFQRTLSRTGVTLRIAGIHRVLPVGERWASIEDRLTGTSLRPGMDNGVHAVADTELEAVLAVLSALAAVSPDPGLTVLPVLPGEHPLPGRHDVNAELADLIERRARRFREPMHRAVTDIDSLVLDVTSGLRELRSPDGLVHGDLIPGNILTAAGQAPAVIDFGFLTVVGDPALDAAITASIFDMYGPRARDNERVLDEAIRDRFGHDRRRILTHRAAYALLTANCFSSSGSDGHFAWCTAMLSRPEIRDAVSR